MTTQVYSCIAYLRLGTACIATYGPYYCLVPPTRDSFPVPGEVPIAIVLPSRVVSFKLLGCYIYPH